MSKWLIGAVTNTTLGFIIGILLSVLVRKMTGINPGNGAYVLALGLGACITAISAHNVPVGFRGVLNILGKRYRKNGNDKGYEEGLVIPPLPWPIAVITVENALEITMDLPATDILSKDNLPVKIDAVVQYLVVNPAEFQSVENAHRSLQALALATIRSEASKEDAMVLPHIKSQVADRVYGEINKNFEADPASPGAIRWGLKVLFVRFEHVTPPSALLAQYTKLKTEPLERQAEMIQTKARQEQIERLVGAGLSPDHAAVVALKDADKEGVQVISVIGLEGFGDTAKKIGDAAKKFAGLS